MRIRLRIMRKSILTDALFPKTRQAILAATLLRPERWWYLSDLAKHLGVPPSSLQRELTRLVDAGILLRRQDGNRVYFRANTVCPVFPELHGILVKTVGLVEILREAVAPFADRICLAFIYGSMARAAEHTASDIDLMIVGTIGLADLAPTLQALEQRLARPVNATLYTPDEWAAKIYAGHHFLLTVLDDEKLFIIGTSDDVAATHAGASHPTPHHEP